MTRKPIAVVKSVLHRNCSDLPMPKNLVGIDADTWCDYAPFGEFFLFDLVLFIKIIGQGSQTFCLGVTHHRFFANLKFKPFHFAFAFKKTFQEKDYNVYKIDYESCTNKWYNCVKKFAIGF